MKAFVVEKYTGPLRETDVPEPIVGEEDVLVQISASGLNHLDERLRSGAFKQILPYPVPLTLGHDLAGTVTEVGGKVTDFAPGDVVYGRVRDGRIGTFAERISVHQSDLALVPSSVTEIVAAGLPLVALTAWQALVDRGNVQSGDKVLIHAGAGGVGAMAIQIAKHLGAHVATTVSAGDAEYVRGLGADMVIDYRAEQFEQLLSGYDFVLDSLGGENLEKSLHVLRPGGLAIGISGPPTPAFAKSAGLGIVLQLAVGALSRRVRGLAKRLGVKYEFMLMHASGTQLREITSLIDSGVLRPMSVSTYPFSETSQALEALTKGEVKGKVVITHP